MMLRAKDIAKDLGKTPRTIYRWMEKGLIRSFEFNNQYYVKEEDYQEFLDRSNGLFESKILTQKGEKEHE